MLKDFFQKFSFIIFVFISYTIMAVSATIQILLDIPSFTQVSFNTWGFILWFFMVFSPTISAVLVVSISNGIEGLKKLLKGFLVWKVNWRWYLAALILILAPLTIGVIYIAVGGGGTGFSTTYTAQMIILAIVFGLFSGPIAEEAGWRGFALPRLESRFNAFVSSLILGIIWFVWHIPFYFIADSGYAIPFYIFAVMVIAIGIILTWLYNNTKGSLIITILAHFCFNFSTFAVMNVLGINPYWVFYIIVGTLGVGYVVFVFVHGGFKKFSRKPDEEMPFVKLPEKSAE